LSSKKAEKQTEDVRRTIGAISASNVPAHVAGVVTENIQFCVRRRTVFTFAVLSTFYDDNIIVTGSLSVGILNVVWCQL